MDERALTPEDFVRLAGTTPDAARRILDRHAPPALRYRELGIDERARIEAEVEDVIGNCSLRTVGGDDPRVWDEGWREVADRLRGRSITIESVRPQYFRGEPVCRLEGRYVRGLTDGFEYDVGLALRRLIFEEFLSEASTIVELGCGTGINLLLMAEQFPQARLIGCDWAQPSCDILDEMARQTGRPIGAHIFNMLTASGWDGAEIDARTAVVTVHAMEQLGSRWQAFTDFLCRRGPALCLHIEPLVELYDADSDFDECACRYHRKRNYLAGFYPYIVGRARKGEITLLAARRVHFGGLYHEAYSILAWRPSR